MKKRFATAGILLLATSGPALASGYRIPEQSLNSVARAAGYVAYTPAADAAYFNPANMAWLENRWAVEGDATWIHLSSINYTDQLAQRSGDSENENFFMPTLFMVSPDYNNFRFGFSITAPGGLSKEWQDPYPRTYAEEFTLKIFEFNPTVAYRFGDKFSLGGGVRAIYVDGRVKSNGATAQTLGYNATRSMDGDTLEFGYNLAASYHPIERLNVGLTYRSNVDLGVDGDANLSTNLRYHPRYGFLPTTYSGSTGVEIPLPAVLALGVSYTFFDQLTVELTWDRTYWSKYEELDFTYPTSLTNPVLSGAFDASKPKHWHDSDSWRVSFNYDLHNNWVLMAGFGIDENPVPDSTLGFELPDSDALLYSAGVRYTINKNMEVGIAFLYDYKKSRFVNNLAEGGAVNGTFKDASASLVTCGFSYKF